MPTTTSGSVSVPRERVTATGPPRPVAPAPTRTQLGGPAPLVSGSRRSRSRAASSRSRREAVAQVHRGQRVEADIAERAVRRELAGVVETQPRGGLRGHARTALPPAAVSRPATRRAKVQRLFPARHRGAPRRAAHEPAQAMRTPPRPPPARRQDRTGPGPASPDPRRGSVAPRPVDRPSASSADIAARTRASGTADFPGGAEATPMPPRVAHRPQDSDSPGSPAFRGRWATPSRNALAQV